MTDIENAHIEVPVIEWRPFCGSISCPCMEPNISGPCGEFDAVGNPRCGGCGWPEYRHITSPSNEADGAGIPTVRYTHEEEQ